MTKIVVISISGLFLLAGGAAHPVECGKTSCCCMPEPTDDLTLQQGHCGCGCGQFEETQLPDQSAVSIAVIDTRPLPTKFDYIIETENGIVENTDLNYSDRENSSPSPPLILDNKYTPLLC